MLTSLKSLQGCEVLATDGKAGAVDDVLFDDARWAVRYLVAHTGPWLHRRQVLLSPWAVTEVATAHQTLRLNLTRERIEHSPDVRFDEPVSRQMEKQYFDYFAWPYYWEGTGLWGASPYPGLVASLPDASNAAAEAPAGDPHLRSARELLGYRLQAPPAESDAKTEACGQVQDLIFETRNWAVRYLVVEAGHWWAGKSVLIAPRWASDIRWREQSIHVDLTRAQIRQGPEFRGLEHLDRDYENRLHEHYGFVNGKYWLLESHPTVNHKESRP